MQCGCCGVAIVFFNEVGINDIVVVFGLKQLVRRHILPRCTSRSSARRNGYGASSGERREGQHSPAAGWQVVRALQTLRAGDNLASSDRGGGVRHAE